MRFSVIVAGLFAAAVSAQSDSSSTAEVTTTTDVASSSATDATSTTTDVASSTSNIDPAQDSAQAAMLACLNACDATDVNCQAKCIAVPSPDTQNVNSTTTCVAACPQGNGTAADNLAFADCVNDCIGQYYFTTSGTPNLASSTSGGSGSSGSTGAVTPSVTAVESTVTSDGSTFVTSFSSTIAPSGSGSADSAQSTSSSSAGADMLFSPVGSGVGLFSFLAAFLAL
ncbi:hypothetical protein Hte_005406 [Hypoxylon texense]